VRLIIEKSFHFLVIMKRRMKCSTHHAQLSISIMFYVDWPLQSPDQNPTENPFDVYEKILRSAPRSCREICVSVDGNECCDDAGAF